MIASPVGLFIERVPTLLVGLLAAEGRIPQPAAEILDLAKRAGRRVPTPSEANAYVWVIATEGPSIRGVLAYRDGFDWHSASDVREVVYATGSATVAMIRWLRRNTMKRRIIGAIDLKNERMGRALHALGYTPTRVVYEDLR